MYRPLAPLAFSILLTVAIAPQIAVYRLNIPAQPLGAALRAFAVASQQQIVFDETVVRGRRSGALFGRFTADQALARIIRDDDLAFSQTERGVYVVQLRRQPESRPSA